MAFKGDYKGAEYAPVRRGFCTRHRRRVGSVTGCCYSCHVEQLADAGVPPISSMELGESPASASLLAKRKESLAELREKTGL